MAELMKMLRTNPPKAIGGLKVKAIADYASSEETDTQTGAKTVLTLPKSDVLVFKLESGASVIIRPSGTEPKIKAYYTTIASSHEESAALNKTVSDDFKAYLGF